MSRLVVTVILLALAALMAYPAADALRFGEAAMSMPTAMLFAFGAGVVWGER